MSAATIAAALGDARREGRAWRCRCPLHGGRSLTLRDGDGDRLLVWCFGGCDSRPPGDVSPKRWLRFIDDCGRFLDSGWAAHAVKLNWHPLDLFGCDRERPFARVDHAGLLWLLNGRQLLALTADTAAIATPSGGSLTFRRRPVEQDHVVLAWDLKQ